LYSSSPYTVGFECSVLTLFALLAAGCAGVAPSPAPAGPAPGPFAPAPTAPASPPANINLQGFPLEYRQGYADGCTSATGAERKDTARFASDGQYRTGWQDGNALCRKR
jgi:hypothetical protein